MSLVNIVQPWIISYVKTGRRLGIHQFRWKQYEHQTNGSESHQHNIGSRKTWTHTTINKSNVLIVKHLCLPFFPYFFIWYSVGPTWSPLVVFCPPWGTASSPSNDPLSPWVAAPRRRSWRSRDETLVLGLEYVWLDWFKGIYRKP